MELGPLARDGDGRWGLGDPVRRVNRHQLLFLREGLEYRRRGERKALVPWSRFMELHLVGPRMDMHWYTGPRLNVTLRSPYEGWEVRYTRHRHVYSMNRMWMVNELVGQAVTAGEAERLGDPDWLTDVVGQLLPQRPWVGKQMAAVVAKARAEAGRRAAGPVAGGATGAG